jgi:hypothetical protein
VTHSQIQNRQLSAYDGEFWAWIGKYDSFLGYMAGVLPLLKAGQAGFEPL